MLAGCSGREEDSPIISSSSQASSSENPEEDAGPVQMTWEVYRARGSDGANYAWFAGTVTAAEKRDDSYGTPYYHLNVQGDDGHDYSLVSNYHSLPFDFVAGMHYRFTVYTAAARGVLVAEAVEE